MKYNSKYNSKFKIIFHSNNTDSMLYYRSINVNRLLWLIWFLKVTWHKTQPEDGTEVLKHVRIAILRFYFYSTSALGW